MGFLDWLFNREPSSRDVAKERLQVVLIYDRAGISPELMDTLREEIVDVLSRHVEIDQHEIELTVTPGDKRNESKLVANIPFRGRAQQDRGESLAPDAQS